MQYFDLFLQALILTILIEGLVLFIASRLMGHKIPFPTLVFCAIVCSGATLPFVWYVFPAAFSDKLFAIGISEIFAILAEWAILCRILKLPMKDCLILSVVCNLVSFSFGVIFSL